MCVLLSLKLNRKFCISFIKLVNFSFTCDVVQKRISIKQ